MKKWDCLDLECHSISTQIIISSTNPDEIIELNKQIVEEGFKYFSYIRDIGKKELKINSYFSYKKHRVTVYASPVLLEARSDDNRNIDYHDLYNFVLNIIKERNWILNPGNNRYDRFIKYYEAD